VKPLPIVVLVVSAVAALAAAAQAAVPTHLTVNAPASVGLGEEIILEARLATADGQPVAGARLELRQVGAVGERMIAEAQTDAEGTASFVHREYSVAALSLRVAFAGSPSRSGSQADTLVTISGVEPERGVVMSHAPGPLAKGTLFLVLGAVWLTYIYAVSRVVRVRLDKEKEGDPRRPVASRQAHRSLEGGRSR